MYFFAIILRRAKNAYFVHLLMYVNVHRQQYTNGIPSFHFSCFGSQRTFQSSRLSVKNSGGHDDGALLALQQGGLRQHDLVLTHGRKQAAFELGSRSRPPSSIVTLLP